MEGKVVPPRVPFQDTKEATGAMSVESVPDRKRAADDMPTSPARQRVAPGVVDVATLKNLLAEQSANFLEQQRATMSEMMRSLREELRQGDEAILAEVRAQQREIEEVRSGQATTVARLEKLEQAAPHGVSQEILDRLQVLETKGGSSTVSTFEPSGTERHRFTLIFGGWPRDSPRKTVLSELHEGLRRHHLAKETDFPGFCTGPRKSLALMSFRIREHEDYQGMRDRMARVVSGVASGAIMLAGGGKMWSGFSKPRAERLRGSHAALIRRVVRALGSDKEPELEAEYSTGSTWLGVHKLSSASVPPDGLQPDEVMEMDPPLPGAPKPWTNLGAMAECLGVDRQTVKEEIGRQMRMNP